MFNLIPFPWKLGAVALLILFAGFYGYTKGSNKSERALLEYKAKAEKQISELTIKSTQINDRVVTEYIDRYKTIKDKEYIYINKVNTVVQPTVDMTKGWIYVHDQVVKSEEIDNSLASSVDRSGVKDNTALGVVVSNYSICEQNASQLKSLQDWITKEQELVEESNKITKKGKYDE